MSKRRASVFGAAERRHVRANGIIDRVDVAFRERNADQHGGDGLGHRPRGEAMPIVPAVLVTLDEDRVAARDEEAGGRVAPEVVVERAGLAPKLVAERRLGVYASERRRRGGAANQPAFEDLIEMTLRADEERDSKEG